MELGRPVLVVPCHSRHVAIGRNVLVAWDGSAPATRALALALPLLARAASVHVAVFQHEADEAPVDPEAMRDLGRNLERHGVAVTLQRVVADHAVAPALRLRAADEGADLIVMGAYGHSRMREWVLGGATREMLEGMSLPVLLSH
jgi:nucleotide-binding universal stress UspA family protein